MKENFRNILLIFCNQASQKLFYSMTWNVFENCFRSFSVYILLIDESASKVDSIHFESRFDTFSNNLSNSVKKWYWPFLSFHKNILIKWVIPRFLPSSNSFPHATDPKLSGVQWLEFRRTFVLCPICSMSRDLGVAAFCSGMMMLLF